MKTAIYLDDVNQAIDNAMQWNVMSQFGEALTQYQEVEIIDPKKIGVEKARRKLLNQEYDALLTYNKTGVNLKTEDGKNLLSALERPQLSWLVEHPVTFYDLYKETNNEFRNYIYPNINHKFFATKMGMQGEANALLFGAKCEKIENDFSKREFDICIAAQYRGKAEDNEFWRSMNGQARKFWQTVAELQHLEDNGDILIPFLTVAEYYKISIEDLQNFAQPLKAIYWHGRKKERIKMIQDLASTGLKICLVGNEQWKDVLPQYNNITFMPTCRQSDLIKIYKKSKSVASTNCYNGANERTFDAISCGCLSISENSPTLTNHFKNLESIIYYKRLKLNEEAEIINDIINNNTLAENITNEAMNLLKQNHTWHHRAKNINQILSKIDQNKDLNSSNYNYSFANQKTDYKTKSTNGENQTAILYQPYFSDAEKSKTNNSCTPYDASWNTGTNSREYKLFKDILNRNIPRGAPWGLVSRKFKYKSIISESEFINFANKNILNGYDCIFINPMIGNEAVFSNVWEQGINCHPGMSELSSFMSNKGFDDRQYICKTESFGFCNYFIGTDIFWSQYTNYVDLVFGELMKEIRAKPTLKEAWNHGASYSKDKSLNMEPFFIERLFSSFLNTNDKIQRLRFPTTKNLYQLKFGITFGSHLFNVYQEKIDASNVMLFSKKRYQSNRNSNSIELWNQSRLKILKSRLRTSLYQLDDPIDLLINNNLNCSEYFEENIL